MDYKADLVAQKDLQNMYKTDQDQPKVVTGRVVLADRTGAGASVPKVSLGHHDKKWVPKQRRRVPKPQPSVGLARN